MCQMLKHLRRQFEVPIQRADDIINLFLRLLRNSGRTPGSCAVLMPFIVDFGPCPVNGAILKYIMYHIKIYACHFKIYGMSKYMLGQNTVSKYMLCQNTCCARVLVMSIILINSLANANFHTIFILGFIEFSLIKSLTVSNRITCSLCQHAH